MDIRHLPYRHKATALFMNLKIPKKLSFLLCQDFSIWNFVFPDLSYSYHPKEVSEGNTIAEGPEKVRTRKKVRARTFIIYGSGGYKETAPHRGGCKAVSYRSGIFPAGERVALTSQLFCH